MGLARWGRAVAFASTVVGCSSSETASNASGDGGAGDAAVEPFAVCRETDANAVTVTGYAAEVDGTCTATLPSDYTACVLGRDDLCVQTTLLSSWRLPSLPNQELSIRLTRTGSVPRLKPLHPFGCDFDSLVFASPTPAAWQDALAPVGGFEPTKAYLIVFAQNESDPSQPVPQSPCGVHAAGVTVTASKGKVVYTAPNLVGAIDSQATATNTSGVAIVVLDGAPTFGTSPDVVRVTATRAAGGGACRVIEGHNWDRTTREQAAKNEFAADAPALAGHVTYALYLLCAR